MEFKHAGPDKLRLGIVAAKGIISAAQLPEIDRALETRIQSLKNGLSAEEDLYRTKVRDIFRNGSCKPTGRGKPASEYLLRTAIEGDFPRINAPVDICNLLSLCSLFPISIWDIQKAPSLSFIFRLGAEEESYIFNSAGHSIDLHDLIVGCAVGPQGESVPLVNAIKDSMGTKTDSSTLDVAVAIYAPLEEGPTFSLEATCKEFVRLLRATGNKVAADYRIIRKGDVVEIF